MDDNNLKKLSHFSENISPPLKTSFKNFHLS